jgi:hypothetical protein
MDFWDFWRWTSFYNTSLLEQTCATCVCFDEINSANTPTTFIVTASTSQSASCGASATRPKQMRARLTGRRRATSRLPLSPSTFSPAASLAPQFPWTEVGGGLYWDGGLVDNTPLGDAIEALSRDTRRLSPRRGDESLSADRQEADEFA